MKHSRVQSTGTHHTGYDQGGAAEASFPVETAQRTKSKQQAARSQEKTATTGSRHGLASACGMKAFFQKFQTIIITYYVLCIIITPDAPGHIALLPPPQRINTWPTCDNMMNEQTD